MHWVGDGHSASDWQFGGGTQMPPTHVYTDLQSESAWQLVGWQ
jgi:hypothetical protein